MAFSCFAQNSTPAAGEALHNPVLNKDFPDPTIIHVNGKYYAYATQSVVNGKMWNIQVATSTDLQNWTMENDALPQKPVWANATQSFWAPHVIYDEDIKKYVLFFSAKSNNTATLYWGSCFQPIKVQEMKDSWKDFKIHGNAIPLVWPGKEKNYTNLLEGAWLDYEGGKYYLYYSGEVNAAGSSVLLEQGNTWTATGHNSIFRGKIGKIWIAYHVINIKDRAQPGSHESRVLCVSQVEYKNGWQVIRAGQP
ncbi:MAG: hypothetical protein NVSMB7_06960 [Chitinophagaceae bacterium]